MSRADRITPEQKVPEYYSDIPMNLDKNPVTQQIDRIINEECVSESIRNLVLTNVGERPYQPWLGSKIKGSLFDNIDDPITIENIKLSITDCIRDNEPRAQNVGVEIFSNIDDNAIGAKVYYSLHNITAVFVAELTIDRIR